MCNAITSPEAARMRPAPSNQFIEGHVPASSVISSRVTYGVRGLRALVGVGPSPNRALQRTLDPSPIFSDAKIAAASSAAELER